MDVTGIKRARLLIRLAMLALGVFATLAAVAGEVRIESGKTTLNANVTLAAGEHISGTVVLMLHGTLGHKDMEIMTMLQSVLQESGLSSLAINLSLDIDDRHGFYDCNIPHTHQAEDAFDELGLWIAWLEEQGADEIILLGHSRGANQIARYAASKTGSETISAAAEMVADPVLIRSAILLAPSTGASAARGTDVASLADDWLPENIDFLHCRDAQVSVASYLSYMGPDANADTTSVLATVRIPTLVISGTADAVVPELSQRMADVDNPAVTHVEIDGAGHFFRDLFAYDVVDVILEFFDQQLLDQQSLEQQPQQQRPITLATSLQLDGEQSASSEKPILIMISQQGCVFCQLLRKEVLQPMLRAGRIDDRVIFREVSLDAGFSLTDFSGQAVAGREFAARYGVVITPTLLFLDSTGEQLTDPIVGTGNIEYYGFYMERAIDAAVDRLLRSNGPDIIPSETAR